MLTLLCIVAIALLSLLPVFFTKWLIDDAFAHRSLTAAAFDVGGMVVAAIAAGIISVYQGFLSALIGEGIMRDLRTSLVAHMQRMSLAFFTSTKPAKL